FKPVSAKRPASLIQRPRSKSFTSAAKVVGKRRALKWLIGPTPLRPSHSAPNISATLWPSGVTAPMPVMTTRLRMIHQTPNPRRCNPGAFKPFPLPHAHRRTLPHRREVDLQDVRALHRPRLAGGDVDRAGGVGLLVVERRRDRAVFHRDQAGGQL